MKTKEFIKKVKSLGFEIRTEYGRKGEPVEFWIGDGEQDFVVIWPKFTFAISTIDGGFTDFKYPLPLDELYKLCFEYASTPVKDREEEKYYLVKFSEKEIEEIKEKFDTDLKDFELVEVENE